MDNKPMMRTAYLKHMLMNSLFPGSPSKHKANQKHTIEQSKTKRKRKTREKEKRARQARKSNR